MLTHCWHPALNTTETQLRNHVTNKRNETYDLCVPYPSFPPTLPPKLADGSEGQEQGQEEQEGAALPVEMPPGDDGPRHLCRQRRQVKREGFVASDEPGLSFAQPKGGMSQARRAAPLHRASAS